MQATGKRRRLCDRTQRRPLCITPVAFTRQGAKRWPAPSGALAQRLAGTEGNAALCKSEAGGRSGRVPQLPRTPRDSLVVPGHGGTPPCPLTETTEHRTGSSGDVPLPPSAATGGDTWPRYPPKPRDSFVVPGHCGTPHWPLTRATDLRNRKAVMLGALPPARSAIQQAARPA